MIGQAGARPDHQVLGIPLVIEKQIDFPGLEEVLTDKPGVCLDQFQGTDPSTVSAAKGMPVIA